MCESNGIWSGCIGEERVVVWFDVQTGVYLNVVLCMHALRCMHVMHFYQSTCA